MGAIIESELKYRFSNEDSASVLAGDPQLLQAALQPWHSAAMITVYYDAADRRLQQAGIALRLRRYAESAVLCCKYNPIHADDEAALADTPPLSLRSRHEDEVFLDNLPSQPDELPWHLLPSAAMLQGVLCGEKLQILAGTEFIRQSMLVLWLESEIEIAVDEGFLTNASTRQAFLELELELKQGNVADLCNLGELLAARYELLPEPKSKLQRATEGLELRVSSVV